MAKKFPHNYNIMVPAKVEPISQLNNNNRSVHGPSLLIVYQLCYDNTLIHIELSTKINIIKLDTG